MWFLYFIPKNFLSFFVGKLVRIRCPQPLGFWLVQWFIKKYSIDMSEAEKDFYSSIGDLFVRRLKHGLRPLSQDHYVHPADSTLTGVQSIDGDQLIQAKDKFYSLKTFIHGTEEELKTFKGGGVLTYYLCPTDYHRVHSPMEGLVESCEYLPGRLWPVNPWSVENISQLFSINERVIIRLQTPHGPLILVMVGATNVGQITLSFEPEIITNVQHFRKPRRIHYSTPLPIKKGEELGVFHMGSTVIVLTSKNLNLVSTEIASQKPTAPLPAQVKWGESFTKSQISLRSH